MSEILFRAKRLDNGEWTEGNLVWSDDSDEEYRAIIIPKEESCMFVKGENPTGNDLGFENWYLVDSETVCRYTGLTDKNGRMVFEGDIIKYHFGEEYAPIKYGVYQSCFDSTRTGHCGFYVDWGTDLRRKDLGYWVNMVDAEIVGNIFDNPKLTGEED